MVDFSLQFPFLSMVAKGLKGQISQTPEFFTNFF